MQKEENINENLHPLDPVSSARTKLFVGFFLFFGGLLLLILSGSLASLFVPNPDSDWEQESFIQISSFDIWWISWIDWLSFISNVLFTAWI